MTVIANRTAPAVEGLVDVIRAGLGAQINAINTQLAVEGADYTLPTAFVVIDRAAQGAKLPEATPAIYVEAKTSTNSGAAGATSVGKARITCAVYVYVGLKDLTLADPLTRTATNEALLAAAADELVQALERTIGAGVGSVGAGVHNLDRVAGFTRQVNLWSMDRREVIGLRGWLGFTMLQRTQHLSTGS